MARLKHVGVSNMRLYTASRLRELREPEVICDHADPIAVMVPYWLYLEWQDALNTRRKDPMTDPELVNVEWRYECMHCGATYWKTVLTFSGGLHCSRCDELTESPQRVLYEPTIEKMLTHLRQQQAQPPTPCVACKKGYPTYMLDEDGVRTDVSKRGGATPCHAVDDAWWPCTTWVYRADLVRMTAERDELSQLLATLRQQQAEIRQELSKKTDLLTGSTKTLAVVRRRATVAEEALAATQQARDVLEEQTRDLRQSTEAQLWNTLEEIRQAAADEACTPQENVGFLLGQIERLLCKLATSEAALAALQQQIAALVTRMRGRDESAGRDYYGVPWADQLAALIAVSPQEPKPCDTDPSR